MKNEKYINRSLEELAMAQRKIEKEFSLIFVVASSFPILGVLFHNNLELLVGGSIVSLTSFLLKFKETMSFILNKNYYYCHSLEYQDAYVPYYIFLLQFRLEV